MAASKDTWEQIQYEYTEGTIGDDGHLQYPTFNELEKRHGIHRATISRRCQKGNWDALRFDKQNTYQRDLLRNVKAVQVKTISNHLGAAYDQVFRVTSHILNCAENLICDTENPLKSNDLRALQETVDKAHLRIKAIAGDEQETQPQTVVNNNYGNDPVEIMGERNANQLAVIYSTLAELNGIKDND